VALTPESWPAPLRRAIRTSNKYLLNPLMRRVAKPTTIRHVGRNSGREFVTPVGAERVPDGFVIPLGYGAQVDWLKNVLASGGASVTANGTTHDVHEPRVIDAAEALPMLESRLRRRYERLGIARNLQVTFVEKVGG
jgi:deazaflavin-dependent oxidoreductase (nitroreductase family)